MGERLLTDSQNRVTQTLLEQNITPNSIFVERFILLDRFTPTLEDEKRGIGYAKEVFRYTESIGRPFTEDDKRKVTLGTLFTDIGKSGPAHASQEHSELIVRIYSIENISSEEMTGSLEKFIEKHFANDDPIQKLADLTTMGIDTANLSMRDFYNLHTTWTLDILTQTDLPKEIALAAASHHRIRGDNPHGIFNDNDTYTGNYGVQGRYGRAEKLISLIDQYDAFRRRGNLDHTQAIGKLRELVATTRSGFYAHDSEFYELIEDLDGALHDN